MKKLLALALTFSLCAAANMKAQDKGEKFVRIHIEDNGKVTDTSFVLHSKDQKEIQQVITAVIRDSAETASGGDIFLVTGHPAGRMVLAGSSDNKQGNIQRELSIIKTLKGDSMNYFYTVTDSAFTALPMGNMMFIKENLHDTILLMGDSEIATRDKVIIHTIKGKPGKEKKVEVIVDGKISDGQGPMEMVRMAHLPEGGNAEQFLSGMPLHAEGTEIKDLPGTNEFPLESISFMNLMHQGKFLLHFSTPEKGELMVKITDEKKQEVFSERMKYFNGQYHQEIQLNPEKQGRYLMIISLGKKKIKKEILIKQVS
jgi:hypothetical protein